MSGRDRDSTNQGFLDGGVGAQPREEEALRESQDFNRCVVESSRDCIKILGLDGTLLMMTESGRALLGIESLEDYIGRSWVDFWQGEDQVAARIAVRMAAAGGVGSLTGMLPRLDGEPRWWDVRVTPIPDARESITRLLAVSRDVTDRQRSQSNAALLATITEEISWLTDVSQVLQAAGEKIGAHLDLTSCVFVEVDESAGTAEVTHEWRRDSMPPTVGKHRMEDYFTEDFQKSCHAGDTFVVDDTATDPRTDTARFARLNIASFVSVPMVRGGSWRFSLSAHRRVASNWRKDEIELLNELTPRILAHLERVRADETSARLAAIVEFSGDAIVSKDLNGVITSWNKGAEKVFGYTASEVIGRPITLLMPPDRVGEEEDVLERIRRGESIGRYETVRQVKDGRLIDIALTVSPIVNARGEVVGASKIARDITARKRAVEAQAAGELLLRASETRFRTALGLITSIVWTNDPTGKMKGEQPGWEQFTGQSREAYQDYGWSAAIHPDDAQPTIDAWEQAVAGKRLFEFEHRVRRPDGEWRWCSVRAMPVLDDDGSIREWVGVHHDITERRSANLNVALLASLSEDMLRVTGMGPLMRILGEKLGKHLGLSRCVFFDVNEAAGTAEVVHNWLLDPGQDLCGPHPLTGHLSPGFCRAALGSEPLVVSDAANDPRCDPEKMAALQVGSFISLPFLRNGQLSFLLSIHHREAHDWREDEIDLMREVAARFWARLERSRAEDALARAMAESEQQRRLYHTVLSNTPDFIYVFDLNHRFSYINDALLKVYGLSWEEAKGRDWIGLGYEPWHADMHDREIDQVIATKAPIRGEIPFTGTTGRRIYDYIFAPVFDRNGEVEAVAGTTRDITERKQIESAQAAERKVFERIATGGSIGEVLDTLLRETEDQSDSGMRCSILLLDKSGRKLVHGAAPSLPAAYNGALEGLVCGPLMGSCGSAAFERRPVFVSDIATDPHWADLRELAAAHHLAACCSMPIFSLKGQVLGTVAMYYSRPQEPSEHDRYLIERAKRLAAIIIERKQAEAALAEQTEELLRSDRNKDEFLAMLAHELRNPLAPIRNATEILHDPSAGSAAIERARRLIARQTENMSRMIDDLLDVSRITEGKIELRTQTVELQKVLAAASEAMLPGFEANGQTLTVSLPEPPVFLNADATRLEQLFGNLLGNACKYSGAGSHIELAAEVAGDREVVVRVADNGIGIDPELLPRIFDLFVQSSRTLDRSHGGLGIGLTIVDRLVRLHGGRIEARSPGPGQGCEFIVHLPRCEAPAVLPAASGGELAGARSLRILIVDDNEDAAESMAMLQELRGHRTRVAHQGADALALAAEFSPEVVLLDIGLPGMDGFEIARRLRALPAVKDAFLVALTGYGSESDRQRAHEAGFDRHLTKPANMKALGDWLEAL